MTEDLFRVSAADYGYYVSAPDIGAAKLDLDPSCPKIDCYAAQGVAQAFGALGHRTERRMLSLVILASRAAVQ